MSAVTWLDLDGCVGAPYAFEEGDGLTGIEFISVSGVALSALAVTSNTITLTGITGTLTVTVAGDAGFGYSKNGGGFVQASGSAAEGDTFAVQVNASALNNVGTQVTLTINGVPFGFNVTTLRAPPTDESNVLRMRRLGGRR